MRTFFFDANEMIIATHVCCRLAVQGVDVSATMFILATHNA